ncbi:nicotinate-nucleotide adenylyltransferase [Roseivivax lentus]|uniref:Probable nicotinate-nucleotide adenylyltransferase n=1 Tax=Roseivivax lentus TaxID=633194 RepID=A0A1N7NG68_9RHOB|nr:nicotinate-nucleotide adenylyltransferase [Roseivivax lentus]SIS97354.1 nicotinate-nucleotide adenylyltransferase [Roseivivax lentus]
MQRGDHGLSLPDGVRIGLLGGSFDPPHAGHVHLSREALKRFGLARVIWLVSPGNPLKAEGPAPLSERLAAARALTGHPRIEVSDIEARLGTRYTADTIAALQALYPRVAFTWLMGADNLVQFHRWDRWREIAHRVPMGILARPGSRMAALNAKASRCLAEARLPAHAARALPSAEAPAWCFLNMPMSPLSSTALRTARAGG